MQSDRAPFSSNSFLYFNERQRLLNLKKLYIIRARTFCKSYRFLDDQNTLNCCVEFEQYISELNSFN